MKIIAQKTNQRFMTQIHRAEEKPRCSRNNSLHTSSDIDCEISLHTSIYCSDLCLHMISACMRCRLACELGAMAGLLNVHRDASCEIDCELRS